MSTFAAGCPEFPAEDRHKLSSMSPGGAQRHRRRTKIALDAHVGLHVCSALTAARIQ
jgi:hypothetical protein